MLKRKDRRVRELPCIDVLLIEDVKILCNKGICVVGMCGGRVCVCVNNLYRFVSLDTIKTFYYNNEEFQNKLATIAFLKYGNFIIIVCI